MWVKEIRGIDCMIFVQSPHYYLQSTKSLYDCVLLSRLYDSTESRYDCVLLSHLYDSTESRDDCVLLSRLYDST